MTKLQDVSLLRSFAVVSLVVWHSYCAYVCWGIAETPANEFYTFLLKSVFPDASMPLFTFLSGYLFCYLFLFKGKYQSFKEFFFNKVHRLLIPYLVLGFVINMTELGRQHPFELFLGTPNHLWFCLMLFYCFLICWWIEKKYSSIVNIVFMCLSFLLVLLAAEKNIIPLAFGCYMPVYYYGYFYFGFLVFKHKEFFLKYAKKYLALLILLFVIFCILFFEIEKLGTHFLLMKCLFYLLIMFVIANSDFVKKNFFIKSKFRKCIVILEKYSFGIYVFHQWIIWNVTRYSGTALIIQEHYIIFPIILFFCVLGVSFTLTHLSMKSKIGRYFLC